MVGGGEPAGRGGNGNCGISYSFGFGFLFASDDDDDDDGLLFGSTLNVFACTIADDKNMIMVDDNIVITINHDVTILYCRFLVSILIVNIYIYIHTHTQIYTNI